MVTLTRIASWLPHQPKSLAMSQGTLPCLLRGFPVSKNFDKKKKSHLGFLGSPNIKGSLVKYVSRLVAMEICFKDSPSQGTLTSTDRKSGFDLSIQYSSQNHWEQMPSSSEVLEPAWFARECGDALWEALLLVVGYPHVTEKLEYFEALCCSSSWALCFWCSILTLPPEEGEDRNSRQCSQLSWEMGRRGETKSSAWNAVGLFMMICGFVYDSFMSNSIVCQCLHVS